MSATPANIRGVLCAGSINYDIVVRPVEAPQWGTTTFVDTLEYMIGGNGANTSIALATLGVPVKLIGALGTDDSGNYLRKRLEDIGVDVSAVADSSELTSTTLVLINGDGNRKFLNRPGVSRVVFDTPLEFSEELVAGSVHLHIASLFILPRLRHTAPETLRRARLCGLTTSLDTTWDPMGEWMDALEPCLNHLDFLFMNEDEARMVTGYTDASAAAQFVLSRGVRTAVMKLGPRGCGIYTRDSEILVPAFDIDVVDTTGAGDCFVAGFLSEFVENKGLEEAGAMGNALGALAVRKVGAVTGVLDRERTRDWMKMASLRY